MADIFDYSEIKRVSKIHNNMITQMKSIVDRYEINRKNMVSDAYSCCAGPEIQDMVKREYDEQPVQLDNYPELFALVKDIYVLRYLEPIRDEFIVILNKTVPTIEDNLLKMNYASNKFKALFLSKAKKNEANDAFIFLSRELNGDYGLNFGELVDSYNGIFNADEESIKNDFKNNKENYLRVFNTEVGKDFKDTVITINSEMVEEYNRFNECTTIDDDVINKTKNEIVGCIGSEVQLEAMKKLHTIPVQEICRGSIVRPTALINAGFRTVGDVCCAMSYSLSSKRGISERGASEVKANAELLKKEIERNTKIKISLDNMTTKKQAILFLISVYKEKLKAIKQLIEEKAKTAAELERNASILQSAGTGIRWLFTSDDEKKRITDSYKYMKDTLYSNYAIDLYNLVKDITDEPNADYITAKQKFEKDPVSFFTVIEDICPGALGTDDKFYGLDEDFAQDLSKEQVLLDGLKCTLRAYQDMGVRYILHQKRVLLGDEMGLGKTIQAIATMVTLSNMGFKHFVVVCPASVLINWCREIIEHSKLEPIKVHGFDKKKSLTRWIKQGGVCVTTYETTNLFTELDEYNIDLLVVDEAHYIKNPTAIRTKNVKGMCGHTERLLFMTGTPLENRVEEMVSLISMLRPDISRRLPGYTQGMYSDGFKKEIMPVYYRRKRDDVLTELPEKIESQEWLEMTGSDMDGYIYALNQGTRNQHEIRKVSWTAPDINKSSKARRMKELILEAYEDGRKIIVYSFYVGILEKVRDLLGDKCVGVINGSVSPKERQNLIDKFDESDSGAVLVAQIQSGGVGLNIQSASVIIICEPQVKPSIENQAISRAYRMGQTRNVLVYRLLCKNSIDERMIHRLEMKQREFDKYADESLAAEQYVSIDDKSMTEMIDAEIKEKLGTKTKVQERVTEQPERNTYQEGVTEQPEHNKYQERVTEQPEHNEYKKSYLQIYFGENQQEDKDENEDFIEYDDWFYKT